MSDEENGYFALVRLAEVSKKYKEGRGAGWLAQRFDEERDYLLEVASDATRNYRPLFSEIVDRFPKGAVLEELTSEQLADFAAVSMSNNVLTNTVKEIGLLAARRDLIQSYVALERAWAAGEEVQALEDLVPTYLPEIPIDPFDGNPLKFDPEKRVLYSIGQDRIDSGGVVKKEGAMRDHNEIVIAFPER